MLGQQEFELSSPSWCLQCGQLEEVTKMAMSQFGLSQRRGDGVGWKVGCGESDPLKLGVGSRDRLHKFTCDWDSLLPRASAHTYLKLSWVLLPQDLWGTEVMLG